MKIKGSHLEPIFVDKLHNGAYEISAFVKGYLVHRTYIGYSEIVALRKFRQEFGLRRSKKYG